MVTSYTCQYLTTFSRSILVSDMDKRDESWASRTKVPYSHIKSSQNICGKCLISYVEQKGNAHLLFLVVLGRQFLMKSSIVWDIAPRSLVNVMGVYPKKTQLFIVFAGFSFRSRLEVSFAHVFAIWNLKKIQTPTFDLMVKTVYISLLVPQISAARNCKTSIVYET
jgi:hypothetical protein